MSSKAEQGLAVFQKHVGKRGGRRASGSPIDQARINAFADATLDHQFIHIDPEKSAKLSPYKVTIAHGFLTLSLRPAPGGKIVPPIEPDAYQGIVMGDQLRPRQGALPEPGEGRLARARAARRWSRCGAGRAEHDPAEAGVTIEIEGEPKPACVAETLTRLVYG